ncbi:MAG TPA: NlpC/P60 family protein [Bacteroidales bacterium]
MKRILLQLCVLALISAFVTSCATKSRTIRHSEVTFIKDKQLRKVVDEWIGVPYRYGGNSKSGIDCSGLVKVILANVYGLEPNIRTAEGYCKASNKIRKSKLKEGDLVFFSVPKPTDFHVGVYLGKDKFVHATTSKGVRIDDMNFPYYEESFYQGGRINY